MHACVCTCVYLTFSFPCATNVRCQVPDPVLLVTVTGCKCMKRLLHVVDLKRYLLGCTQERGESEDVSVRITVSDSTSESVTEDDCE